jgi:hypothetical protein
VRGDFGLGEIAHGALELLLFFRQREVHLGLG